MRYDSRMIDETSLSILDLLQGDARISNAEIARRVGLAPSAVFERIRKLEERGALRGYTASVDPSVVDRALLAFVLVRSDERGGARQTEAALVAMPEVQEVHHVAGESDSVDAERGHLREAGNLVFDLAVIVVDYLQLLAPAERRRGGTRAEEVSEISRDLKRLARETGACIVAMAQVNREGANQDGPRLTDLREGGIENDADVVVLMHQPEPDIPEVTMKVAKNRHGPQGECQLQMQGHYARLTSVSWRPPAHSYGTGA